MLDFFCVRTTFLYCFVILLVYFYSICRFCCRGGTIILKHPVHPDKLKLQKIIPFFKKGSKLSTANYRPISLLSNINKIIEKLVFNRVLSFLNRNNVIYEKQFGFRPKHSTNHALINIVDTIRNAIDSGKLAAGVFVDFQKAFDTVDHNILISKLEHYGIKGKFND